MFESANLIRQILLLFYLIVGLLNSAVAAPTLLTLTDLTNHSESTDLIPYLDVGGSLSSQIKVFAKHNGTYSLQKALKRSIGHRYRLALGPLAATTVYIQVYDPKGVARISPTLFSESQMVDSISFRHAFYAFLMSGLLVLAAYNFLYFLHIRDTSVGAVIRLALEEFDTPELTERCNMQRTPLHKTHIIITEGLGMSLSNDPV